MGDTFERIYAQVRRIPAGCVATYGQIAVLAGTATGDRSSALRSTSIQNRA